MRETILILLKLREVTNLKFRSLLVVSKKALKTLVMIPFQRAYMSKLSKIVAEDLCRIFYLLTDHAGDDFIALSLLENLKLNMDSKLGVLIPQEYEPLLRYFPKLMEDYLTIQKEKFFIFESRDLIKFNGAILASAKYGLLGLREKVRTQNLILIGHKWAHLVEFLRSHYVRRIDNYFRFILNLPEDFPLALPFISDEQRKKAKQLFDSYNLTENKTVILAPYSNSMRDYSKRSVQTFEKIASKLAEKGYTVCTNVDRGNPNPIKNTVAVSPPLDLLIPFVDLAGYAIVFRSGFADIVSRSSAKLFVLYPRLILPFGTSFYEYTSISAIFKRNDTVELIGEPEDFLKVLDYF